MGPPGHTAGFVHSAHACSGVAVERHEPSMLRRGSATGPSLSETEVVRHFAGALAVLAPRPAAGPALAFVQLLLGPANAAFSDDLLLGILDPADELIAGQGHDVSPGSECRGVW